MTLKFISILALAVLFAFPQIFAQMQNQKSNENDFVEEVVEENGYEIALIEIALANGTDADLKMHATHMLAGTGVPLKLKINKPIGKKWDAEWAEEMVQKHRKAVTMFERALTFTNDVELRTLIDNTLPTLRSHLDMATTLKTRLKQ
jgi:predicted outer membrane protein